MVYEKVLDENKRLEAQIQSLQAQIAMCPEGKLICSSNGKGQKWYCSDGHISTYLPKKERQFAEQLAYKKYLSLQLKNALHEKKAIEFYLRHHDSDAYQTWFKTSTLYFKWNHSVNSFDYHLRNQRQSIKFRKC